MLNEVAKDLDQEIINAVANVLQRESNDIKPEMTIFGDLGIESVELLELTFFLEQECQIKLEHKDLWQLPNYIVQNKLFENQIISDEAIKLIHRSFPSIDITSIHSLTEPYQLLRYLKISDIIEFVKNHTN